MLDNNFMMVEDVLSQDREQRQREKGKNLLYRVEFRFKGKCCHWHYFETLGEAQAAPDSRLAKYSPFGGAVINYPISRQIQIRGPRGGWKKYTEEKGA